jgi:protoporphyrinogen oxidase
MRIAILGGGIAGLTAAYYLTKKNHQITIFEKETVFGGLALGFKTDHWDWYLERTYHHLFANDDDILNFTQEIGFDKIFFKAPETASLYENPNDKIQMTNQFQISPLDTPIDLLKFPYLNIIDKLRAGIVIAFLKFSPFLSIYEKQTSQEFLEKTMGKKVWNVLWQQLFRGKYGDYAGNILASFIWARIKKRTKNLGYVEGGFQEFINYIEKLLKNSQVNLLTGNEITNITKQGEKFKITGHSRKSGNLETSNYDKIISTLPTPVMARLTKSIFSSNYLSRLKKLKYLHALTLILETDKPILDKTYWLNIATDKIPIMGIVQHTNFIDKKYYSNKHITYLGWYLKTEDKLMNMKDQELLDYVMPHLQKIQNSKFRIQNSYVFLALFAQPIFDNNFVRNKPDFITPNKNFFIANLDMTYPFDRGINYAVRLGKQVTELI